MGGSSLHARAVAASWHALGLVVQCLRTMGRRGPPGVEGLQHMALDPSLGLRGLRLRGTNYRAGGPQGDTDARVTIAGVDAGYSWSPSRPRGGVGWVAVGNCVTADW